MASTVYRFALSGPNQQGPMDDHLVTSEVVGCTLASVFVLSVDILLQVPQCCKFRVAVIHMAFVVVCIVFSQFLLRSNGCLNSPQCQVGHTSER